MGELEAFRGMISNRPLIGPRRCPKLQATLEAVWGDPGTLS